MTRLERIVLAHEPDFTLGRLTVSPPHRALVRDDGLREVLEQRVMQVLVALAKAGGRILTRDELTTLCWDGRVVGEDAINRVMSRLRRSAEEIGAGSFAIETITKVGYRLTGDAPAYGTRLTSEETLNSGDSRHGRTRRRVLIGAAAGLAGLGGGGLLYRHLNRRSLPPEVTALLTRAAQARDFTRESQNEAIALYRRVTELAPNYADGWGLLAFAYATPSHYRVRAEAGMLRQRSASAARRAFDLDPGNAYGELALAAALPFIGRWTERDRHLRRALSVRPDDADVLAAAASLAQSTGRLDDAVKLYERIRPKPLRPSVHNNYVRSLWSAGRMDEVDKAIEDGLSLYPNFGGLWFTRYDMLVMGGRPSEAIAMAQNADGRPTGLTQPELARLIAIARAEDGSDPAAAQAVVASLMRHAHEATGPAEDALRTAAMFGHTDDAFTIADAYYFSRGFVVPDVRFTSEEGFYSPREQRQVHFLFEPLTRSMRADPRFGPLVEELGLEHYWHDSGLQPNYRRS